MIFPIKVESIPKISTENHERMKIPVKVTDNKKKMIFSTNVTEIYEEMTVRGREPEIEYPGQRNRS